MKGEAALAPKFDGGEEIYNSLFLLLDEAIADLGKESLLKPGAADLFYGGNAVKWRKFAKTLKLKMYNQIRLKRDVSAQVRALIEENDLITATDDFEFNYGVTSLPDNRHPGFTGDYAASSRENHVSRWFYDVMKGNNNVPDYTNPLAGIKDPRIPYYFFNQATSAAASSVADYQDGKFITRCFGSRGPQKSANDNTVRTMQGLYPIGGKQLTVEDLRVNDIIVFSFEIVTTDGRRIIYTPLNSVGAITGPQANEPFAAYARVR